MQHLMWFRNDLRLQDNPALTHACKQQTPTIAVFCWAPAQWQSHGLGLRKIDFIRRTLIELERDLQALNIPLQIINAEFKNTPQKLKTLCQQHQIKAVFWNREYELNETLRDDAVRETLNRSQVDVHTFDDQVLLPPEYIQTQQKAVYGVFTPYKKAVYKALHQTPPTLYRAPKAQAPLTLKSQLPPELATFDEPTLVKLWPAGAKTAQKKLKQFCQNDIFTYAQKRDFPDLNSTSSLSPYLAVGAISQKQCFLAAVHANQGEFDSGHPGVQCWVSELIWREFYRYILFHHPRLCRHENYQTKYNTLKWRQSKNDLQRWQIGQTGFPIVDAAMRQLNQTGWMHNRLRMISAMFLTKNLLLDWRLGEAYFLQQLIDADYASNNGGWQWSASTGTDAAPYFRVFNPVRQSEKFDPDGHFIKTYCKELVTLGSKSIHDPSNTLDKQTFRNLDYPKAICDLSATRLRAIEAFKQTNRD